MELIEIFERFRILFHPVECGAEEQIRVIQVLRRDRGRKKLTEKSRGGLMVAAVDELFGLAQDRWSGGDAL